MMPFKQILAIVAISATTAITSVVGYNKYTQSNSGSGFISSNANNLPANYANYAPMGADGGPADFTQAAQTAIAAVVHIKTKTAAKKITTTSNRQSNPFFDTPFEDFFGDNSFFGPRMQPEQRASGSGVLISADGNILTNSHVIKGADEITVTTADKKTYKAKVIGDDPSSDLAVIKIDGTSFPYLVSGNSDDVRIGQWVLAIGYPLSLDCSVTAGIVSAKARSLGLNQRETKGNKNAAIDSYIQHDAAVNPGNSGGALVNTKGELIGINAAIASPTGSYAGYSFTIPINIAKKIGNDLIKHGVPQRAFLGVQPAVVIGTSGYETKDGNGVEIRQAPQGGAAAIAGLKAGDVITKINNKNIATWNELVEQIASYSVGDKVTITYTRDGKSNVVPVTLKNEGGNFELATKSTLAIKLGAALENLDPKKAKEYGVPGGVLIKALEAKGILKTQNPSLKNGFVILRVDGQDVNNLEALAGYLENNSQSVVLTGFYPGYEGIFNYIINNDNDK